LIRQNFDEREIGMLFGAATSYPEYRTSYSSVRERYDNLVRYVEDNGVPAVAAAYYGPAQQPVAVYQGEPVRHDVIVNDQDVLVNDEDAVLLDDDPDVVVLRRPPMTSDGRY
jgi:hypothetical protein